MKRAPRDREPRVAPMEIPACVMAELDHAGLNASERPSDEGESRTIVMFSGAPAVLLEKLEPPMMLRFFPELTQPGQPESALQYLRRVVRERKRMLRRQRKATQGWVRNW